MNKKITNVVLIIIIAAVFGAAIWAYGLLPDKIISHWNASGQPDGYSNKFFGLFLVPIIMAVLFLLYLIIPKIDPFKENIKLFRKYYNALWIFLFLFFAYIFSITLIWNLGYKFDFTFAIIPAMSVLFYFIGSILKNVKRNWFLGIRTPWTLSSDIVWEKTHKIGGKLFKTAGVISLLGLIFRGPVSIIFIITPALLFSIYLFVYSYFEYKKNEQK